MCKSDSFHSNVKASYNLDNLALHSIRWKKHHYLTPLVWCFTIICNSYKLQNSVKYRSLFPPYYIFPVAAAQRRSHYVTLATASVAPPCDNSLGRYTLCIKHSVHISTAWTYTQCASSSCFCTILVTRAAHTQILTTAAHCAETKCSVNWYSVMQSSLMFIFCEFGSELGLVLGF